MSSNNSRQLRVHSVCGSCVQPMYDNMSRQLRVLANPMGSSVERLVHVMLRALDLRVRGGAAALINTVPVATKVSAKSSAFVGIRRFMLFCFSGKLTEPLKIYPSTTNKPEWLRGLWHRLALPLCCCLTDIGPVATEVSLRL